MRLELLRDLVEPDGRDLVAPGADGADAALGALVDDAVERHFGAELLADGGGVDREPVVVLREVAHGRSIRKRWWWGIRWRAPSWRRSRAWRRWRSRGSPARRGRCGRPRCAAAPRRGCARRDRGCASRKACCSSPRQRRHAVDVVVAVALDVRDAQQVDQRQVLLHRQAGLRRQVFGRHEVARRACSAFQCRAARRVEHRLVEALAGLRRHAGVAARARLHEACRARRRTRR